MNGLGGEGVLRGAPSLSSPGVTATTTSTTGSTAVHTLSSLPIPCAGGGEAWRGITPLMASHVRTQVREKRKRAERVKCFSNFGQCFRDVNLRNRYL